MGSRSRRLEGWSIFPFFFSSFFPPLFVSGGQRLSAHDGYPEVKRPGGEGGNELPIRHTRGSGPDGLCGACRDTLTRSPYPVHIEAAVGRRCEPRVWRMACGISGGDAAGGRSPGDAAGYRGDLGVPLGVTHPRACVTVPHPRVGTALPMALRGS